MHEHAGRVENAAERRPASRRERLVEPRLQVAGLGARPDLLARALEHLPRSRDRERIARAAHELVDGRKIPQSHGKRV